MAMKPTQKTRTTSSTPPGVLKLLPDTSANANAHPTAETTEGLFERLKDFAEQNLKDLSEATPEQMVARIKIHSQNVRSISNHFKHLTAQKKAHCWIIGKMLGAVKSQVGHGKLESWMDSHLEELGFSRKTAGNYTTLAEKFADLLTLLADERPLKELYLVTPPKTQPTSNDTSRKPPQYTRAEKVVKGCTTLKQDLRLLKDSDDVLSEQQLLQLRISKEEIDQYFETLLSN